ncbi:hypothetical protein OIU78_007267 [Salix suchowensis]|nr:hypothetical protein OIU78_007267 [Salix suchowensis]
MNCFHSYKCSTVNEKRKFESQTIYQPKVVVFMGLKFIVRTPLPAFCFLIRLQLLSLIRSSVKLRNGSISLCWTSN